MDPVRAREPDALARFFDRHAGNVREYCTIVCPTELVDEATFVAFADFLARMATAEADADLDDLLWKATRGAAAGRAEVRAESRNGSPRVGSSPRVARPEPEPTCLAMPELLAAYASGELPRNSQLDRHLVRCTVCRATATRFRTAEGVLTLKSQDQPPKSVRRAWLEIARTAGASRRSQLS